MALTQVSTDGVKNDAISHNKIPANAIQASELADNAVDTAAIANNAVTQQKIAADAVQGTIIANNAITTAKIADDAVTNAKMANNAVDDAVIATAAVTTPKIADDAVTAAKLANDAVISSNIVNGAVDADKLANGAVTTAKLASGAADLINDTTPQLGGSLAPSPYNIRFADSGGDTDDVLSFGASDDFDMFHRGNHSYIRNKTGETYLQGNNSGSLVNNIIFDTSGVTKQLHKSVVVSETTENGIKLPKGCIRGMGGSKVILGGTLDPSQDTTWNFSFGTNDHGYNQGYIFNVKFYVNHWNTGSYYKYIESITGGRGNVTGLERVNLINNLGTGSGSWSSGHLDYSITLSGGTRDGNNVSLFKVTYDADNAPSYTSGYYLEVSYSSQIGTISIT